MSRALDPVAPVRDLRERVGLTQTQLADLGVGARGAPLTQSRVAQLEAAGEAVQLRLLRALAAACGYELVLTLRRR